MTSRLFTTISGRVVIRTFHSLCYDILWDMHKLWPESISLVRMWIFHAYFLVSSSVGNRGKQTFGWLQIMESFSMIWCSFVFLIVRFLARKVGGCHPLTIKVFVLFEKGLRPDSTASARKLPYSLCSYVWSLNSTRKKWFTRLCLLLLLIKSVSSKTNLWSLADLVKSIS